MRRGTGIRCLIGPYQRDLDQLAAQEWTDRGKPDRNYRHRLDNPYELSDDTITAQTIRDWLPIQPGRNPAVGRIPVAAYRHA